MNTVKFDQNNVRHTLVIQNNRDDINWLFIPGGPGVDSSYLNTLANLAQLPGKSWLIDLPGNGNNHSEIKDYDRWFDIFLPTIKQFTNPVVIGHSFGGMITLLHPKLEQILKGLVIISSSPRLWLEEANKYAKAHDLPDLSAVAEFTKNPNQQTFELARDACAPYYFTKNNIELGRKVLQELPWPFETAVWWLDKAISTNYNATWIPQNVPTMIIGGEYDAMTPLVLFKQDIRFHRPNIQIYPIEDAGHLPWLEQPGIVKGLFDDFSNILGQCKLVPSEL